MSCFMRMCDRTDQLALGALFFLSDFFLAFAALVLARARIRQGNSALSVRALAIRASAFATRNEDHVGPLLSYVDGKGKSEREQESDEVFHEISLKLGPLFQGLTGRVFES